MIPLTFTFSGKQYTGMLSPVHGHGSQVYHLMIGNYFYGRLRLVDNSWVFDTNKLSAGFESLAEEMGQVVTNWYQ